MIVSYSTRRLKMQILAHAKQLLLVTFCEVAARIRASFWTQKWQKDGRTKWWKNGQNLSSSNYLDVNVNVGCKPKNQTDKSRTFDIY